MKVRCLFSDIKKAFDTVSQDIIRKKLVGAGIVEPALKWFISYLSYRHQRALVNNTPSSHKIVRSGVPNVQSVVHYFYLLLLMIFRSVCYMDT